MFELSNDLEKKILATINKNGLFYDMTQVNFVSFRPLNLKPDSVMVKNFSCLLKRLFSHNLLLLGEYNVKKQFILFHIKQLYEMHCVDVFTFLSLFVYNKTKCNKNRIGLYAIHLQCTYVFTPYYSAIYLH